MKKYFLSLSFITLFLSTGLLSANGVSGRVVDSNGNGRSGVTVLIRTGNQKVQTTTDSKGYYTLEFADSQAGLKGRTYVKGLFATEVTIPNSGYATVNVTIRKK